VLLQLDGDRRGAGVLPLAAGLALARALERLGIAAELKWPNDVLIEGRKLAGILGERRGAGPPGANRAGEAAVIGLGVNVAEREADFPPALRAHATSLALAGAALDRETVAAAFLDAFEPLVDALAAGRRDAVLEAWRERAAFWGARVTVRTPSGELSGIARRLDDDGALVLALDSGAETTVLAGDLELDEPKAQAGAGRERGGAAPAARNTSQPQAPRARSAPATEPR
jgi:BirA family biotin operon repressor/biotin-[acetyl-CoA-carboxylase] ligase